MSASSPPSQHGINGHSSVKKCFKSTDRLSASPTQSSVSQASSLSRSRCRSVARSTAKSPSPNTKLTYFETPEHCKLQSSNSDLIVDTSYLEQQHVNSIQRSKTLTATSMKKRCRSRSSSSSSCSSSSSSSSSGSDSSSGTSSSCSSSSSASSSSESEGRKRKNPNICSKGLPINDVNENLVVKEYLNGPLQNSIIKIHQQTDVRSSNQVTRDEIDESFKQHGSHAIFELKQERIYSGNCDTGNMPNATSHLESIPHTNYMQEMDNYTPRMVSIPCVLQDRRSRQLLPKLITNTRSNSDEQCISDTQSDDHTLTALYTSISSSADQLNEDDAAMNINSPLLELNSLKSKGQCTQEPKLNEVHTHSIQKPTQLSHDSLISTSALQIGSCAEIIHENGSKVVSRKEHFETVPVAGLSRIECYESSSDSSDAVSERSSVDTAEMNVDLPSDGSRTPQRDVTTVDIFGEKESECKLFVDALKPAQELLPTESSSGRTLIRIVIKKDASNYGHPRKRVENCQNSVSLDKKEVVSTEVLNLKTKVLNEVIVSSVNDAAKTSESLVKDNDANSDAEGVTSSISELKRIAGEYRKNQLNEPESEDDDACETFQPSEASELQENKQYRKDATEDRNDNFWNTSSVNVDRFTKIDDHPCIGKDSMHKRVSERQYRSKDDNLRPYSSDQNRHSKPSEKSSPYTSSTLRRNGITDYQKPYREESSSSRRDANRTAQSYRRSPERSSNYRRNADRRYFNKKSSDRRSPERYSNSNSRREQEDRSRCPRRRENTDDRGSRIKNRERPERASRSKSRDRAPRSDSRERELWSNSQERSPRSRSRERTARSKSRERVMKRSKSREELRIKYRERYTSNSEKRVSSENKNEDSKSRKKKKVDGAFISEKETRDLQPSNEFCPPLLPYPGPVNYVPHKVYINSHWQHPNYPANLHYKPYMRPPFPDYGSPMYGPYPVPGMMPHPGAMPMYPPAAPPPPAYWHYQSAMYDQYYRYQTPVPYDINHRSTRPTIEYNSIKEIADVQPPVQHESHALVSVTSATSAKEEITSKAESILQTVEESPSKNFTSTNSEMTEVQINETVPVETEVPEPLKECPDEESLVEFTVDTAPVPSEDGEIFDDFDDDFYDIVEIHDPCDEVVSTDGVEK